MEKEPIIRILEAKCDHLATQFGSNSKIRQAYLKITELVTKGESLPNAIDIVDSAIQEKTKNQS